MNKNFDDIREFAKGLTYDLDNKQERHNSYQDAKNVRLYSEDGILSLSSIKGTKLLYENGAVTKYLGGVSFKDELILLAKYDNNFGLEIIDRGFYTYTVANQSITYPFSQTGIPDVGLNLQAGLKEEYILASEVEEDTPTEVIDDSNESCLAAVGIFDIADYYRLSNTEVPNYEICVLEQDEITPENNTDISDVIISLKIEDGEVVAKIIWNGYLNLDVNKKVTCVGIDENSHYRRVYLTDSVNPFRTFNRNDPELIYKSAVSFDVVQDVSLLQAEIESTEDDGLLPAMSVQYLYRLITEDGQISKFSPLSIVYKILKEDGKSDFRGGDVEELTTKSVNVVCPVPDFLKYDRIECIALEYRTSGTPTSIKSLGIKDVSDMVPFKHTGSESDFGDVITLAEILTNAPSWKYCNALEINDNKLVAGGLRNQPYPLGVRYLEDQFVLRGWDQNGLTHNCLINPEPQNFKYINPGDENKYISVTKRHFTKMLVYGNFRARLKNLNTDAFIDMRYTSDKDTYVNYMEDIFTWLSTTDLSAFPNLEVTQIGDTMLFGSLDPSSITDVDKYRLQINNDQSIIDFDDEYSINTDSIDTSQLTPGAVSQGFNTGNGIRFSWITEEDLVLTRQEERYASGPIIPLEAPSLKKGYMKDEIYRIAITFFKSGSPLFAIPCGDIKAPAIGDQRISIDSQGNRIDHNDQFLNQRTEGDFLYAQRLLLKAEVRIGCNLKKFVDSYQIQYVERTEFNRTIVAQGISAPMQRIGKFEDINLSYEATNPEVYRKWTLPYRGGPLIDVKGLYAYDTYGDGFEESEFGKDAWKVHGEEVMSRRVLTHRKLMYFDSPDIIYGRVSDELVSSANAKVLGRLKTDHNRTLLSDMKLNENNVDPFNQPLEKTFSKKLWEGGNIDENQLQDVFQGENKETNPYWIDASVFSHFERYDSEHEIDYHEPINEGIIVPGIALGMNHPISNNAMSLGEPSWFYSSNWRVGYLAEGNFFDISNPGAIGSDTAQQMASQFGITTNRSTGYRTLVYKTKTDIYTDELIGDERISMPCNYYTGNRFSEKQTVDTHVLVNLKLNNQETVYGGRSRYAFSKNLFIPLGKVTPVHNDTNQSQISLIEGDTYVTLYTRAKATYHQHKDLKTYKNIQNDFSRSNDSHDEKEANRPSGWVYAVVLETQVEERTSNDYRFYRESAPFNFDTAIQETINPAYSITDNIKYFTPRPYNFKDDPLLLNIIAASKVKLSGDYYDSFTVFLANDFYALNKKRGDVKNIVSELDKLFVIQETATSDVLMDPTDTLSTDEGRDIQVALGTGKVFHSHKEISKYGTAIRGSVVKGDFGFSFYDESKNEFVRINKGLSTQKLLNLQLKKLYDSDPIINTEGWYDDKYKETNILLVSKSGTKTVISYNEVLEAFNGFYDYDADKYFKLKENIFAPKLGLESELHQLNTGDFLNLFGNQKTMLIGIVVNGKGVGNLPGFRRKVEAQIFKALSISVNIDYPVKEIKIYDNIDPDDIRVLDGPTHFRYNIKNGIHTLPLRNISDRAPKRGEWAYITIEIESLNKNKVDLHAIITSLRKSII